MMQLWQNLMSNPHIQEVISKLDFWFIWGFLGQLLFFSRFAVQWYVSEKAGRSLLPTSFWWLSIGGTLMVLVYALVRKDPLFILAFSLNCVFYVRNLMLIYRRKSAAARVLAERSAGRE